MPERDEDLWIDELERDLGQGVALHLLANAGGQRRFIPRKAFGSRLSREIGSDAAEWLSARFGGNEIDIPSLRGRQQQTGAAHLRAAILEAGLTAPRRSANAIAVEYGVTAAWVHKLRTQMRRENGIEPMLPFDDV